MIVCTAVSVIVAVAVRLVEIECVRECDCLLVRLDDPIYLRSLTREPVSRPDPAKAPTEVLELLLTQTVSISRRIARVVGGTIAFDGKHVTSRFLGMFNDEIDTKV